MADVILVCPPFFSIGRPSMGLSALEGALRHHGVSAAVEYLNMDFCTESSVEFCEWLSVESPVNLLLGEWVFAHLIRDQPLDASFEEHYPAELYARLPPTKRPALRDFARARAAAESFIDRSAMRLLSSQPRVVGLSSSFQQTCAALALARKIKQLVPQTLICMGGANCDDPMGTALLENFGQLDFVVSGEADQTFPVLASGWLESNSVSNQLDVRWVDERRGVVVADPVRDMDALPFPDMADYFSELQRTGLSGCVEPGMVIETSRGCWWGAKHHCKFCGLNARGMAYRRKSTLRILQEVAWLAERHGVTRFQAVDNIADPKLIGSLFDTLARRGAPYAFFYEVKANLRHDQLRRMALAGVSHVQPGIESLNDALLAELDKGISALQNVAFLRSCVELGVTPYWNVLYRFPGETDACYEQMLAWLPALEHLPPPSSASTVRLDRYSPYFEKGAELGFSDIRPYESYARIFGLSEQACKNVAYYFQGQSPARVDRGLMKLFFEALEQWRGLHAAAAQEESGGPPVLALLRRAEGATVVDTRRCAREPLSTLSPLELLIHDELRRPNGLSALLSALGPAQEEIRAALQNLLERKFVLRDGERLLSLICEPGQLVFNVAPPFPGGRVLVAASGAAQSEAAC
jgi:magnesium-protoporphyrin IX monomethyl ester (oxidative) cyclase